MIGIIDYGMGNLRSVQKAFEWIGQAAFIMTARADFDKADQLVLPGVGAFSDAMATLRAKGYDRLIIEQASGGKPLLGICLGMQLLFGKSYENGAFQGLGLLEGTVVKLPPDNKVPHVGWNTLETAKEDPLFTGLPTQLFVYFVHSYYVQTAAPVVSATTCYGRTIPAAVRQNRIFGTQFHPEKSGEIGLRMLKNFGGL